MTESIICLGECLIDRLFKVGKAPQKASENWTDYPGGAPANVATAIAKLGTPTCMVSCLGKDDVGDWLVQVVEDQGVQCQIQRVATAPTRIVLVERDETGDRRFVGFSDPNPSAFADAHLAPEWIENIDFAGVDYLVMGTLGLAYPATASAMKRARDKAQQAGTKIVIDLNWRPVFWPDEAIAPQTIRAFLQSADLLKLSLEEAQWLLDTDSAAEICQQFPHLQAVLAMVAPAPLHTTRFRCRPLQWTASIPPERAMPFWQAFCISFASAVGTACKPLTRLRKSCGMPVP